MQTYHPKQVPEVIAAKIGEFWSQLKRFPNETVDNYYNRFQELLDDLAKANENPYRLDDDLETKDLRDSWRD